MFFQETPTTPTPESYKDFAQVAEALKQSVKDMTSLKEVTAGVANVFQQLIIESEQLNKNIVGGRTRIQEFSKTLSDAAPGVARLGGEFKNVRETIEEIAIGTRTTLVATSKQISELYAAQKILGGDLSTIIDSFGAVGISYDKVSKNLEDSINYVSSIGLNAKVVMKDVLANTDAISRFNFQNGVQGLTKMAAQASMLRIDMKKTLDLADQALDPDKAVEMASAFQRLGVSVGNLTDPFQLMNQSINDPSGIQNSIVNMTKQFTYFDEQTKSFKINPQGILTMRELAPQIGMTASEMRKMALSAAEMDDKLKRINTTGFSLNVSEEDKMMVANIAKMGEGPGADYEVSIKDERGFEMQKKLSELTQQDFDRLIKQQRDSPKTLEEIQLSQLNTAEKMLAEMAGVREDLKNLAVGGPTMQRGIEQSANLARQMAEIPRIVAANTGFRTEVEKLRTEMETIRGKKIPEAQKEKEIQSVQERMDTLFREAVGKFSRNMSKEVGATVSQQEGITKRFAEVISGLFGEFGAKMKAMPGSPQPGGIPTTPTRGNVDFGILNKATGGETTGFAGINVINPTKQEMVVNFPNPNLNINVTLNAPPGMNQTTLTEIIVQATNPLKESIYEAVKQVSIAKGEIKGKTA